MDEEEVIDSNQIAQQAMADEQLPDGTEKEKKEPEVDNSKW